MAFDGRFKALHELRRVSQTTVCVWHSILLYPVLYDGHVHPSAARCSSFRDAMFDGNRYIVGKGCRAYAIFRGLQKLPSHKQTKDVVWSGMSESYVFRR